VGPAQIARSAAGSVANGPDNINATTISAMIRNQIVVFFDILTPDGLAATMGGIGGQIRVMSFDAECVCLRVDVSIVVILV